MTTPLPAHQNPAPTASVLSVEPSKQDKDALQDIFLSAAGWPMCPGCRWKLNTSHGVQPALSVLRENSTPIVLCESQTTSGTWRELLEALSHFPDPPLLIVTSRLADERLWAEALNLGAYDVLAKPYERAEVIRGISGAWRHWQERHALPSVISEEGNIAQGPPHPARPSRLVPPAALIDSPGMDANGDVQLEPVWSRIPGKAVTQRVAAVGPFFFIFS